MRHTLGYAALSDLAHHLTVWPRRLWRRLRRWWRPVDRKAFYDAAYDPDNEVGR